LEFKDTKMNTHRTSQKQLIDWERERKADERMSKRLSS
jgi:hypothetical protein